MTLRGTGGPDSRYSSSSRRASASCTWSLNAATVGFVAWMLTSAWKSVTYPDDFHTWVKGKPLPSIPLSNDPGDWTVEFHHIRTPDDYTSVMCAGFTAK